MNDPDLMARLDDLAHRLESTCQTLDLVIEKLAVIFEPDEPEYDDEPDEEPQDIRGKT